MRSRVTDVIDDPSETISLLKVALPNIADDLDFDEGPYVVLGDLAILLRDGINLGRYSESELNAIFEFLNRLGFSENTEVQNQLVVGILEILTDSPECITICRQLLEGPALQLFERMTNGWQASS